MLSEDGRRACTSAVVFTASVIRCGAWLLANSLVSCTKMVQLIQTHSGAPFSVHQSASIWKASNQVCISAMPLL